MPRLSILLLFLLTSTTTVGWLWSSNATWAETFHGAMESSATLLENLGAKLYQHPVVEAVCQQRLCRNGSLPIANDTLTPEPNGCGSYGLIFPREYMQLVSECCDAHDLCYAQCGVKRSHCDHKFHWCLRSLCQKVKNLMGDGETWKACKNAAKNAVGLVKSLGCPTFVLAQSTYCHCPPTTEEL